ncbi:MAG TPA: LysM peptidoglycan-binding domain-containing protein [Vicinamibacteria bacterium]|nr:LysM peptidoglycan-binding domain-containing protein [Vicinamibacteria bacterium]
MGTEARRHCPVCSEPFDASPDECFRCETPLRSWWPFEDAALGTAPQRGPRLLPLAIAALLGTLVAAVALRIMSGTVHAPVAMPSPAGVTPAPPTTAAIAPPPTSAGPIPATVAYRVQPGDSLWRISAAFTGDGRNWRTLWPAIAPSDPLVVGTVLQVPIR